MWRHWRWLGTGMGHLPGYLEQYPAATKYIWTMERDTQHLICLISPTLIPDTERNLFLLMIQIRAHLFMWSSSIDAHVALGWGCWCHEHGVRNGALWHSNNSWHPLWQSPWSVNNVCNNYRPVIGWHDCQCGLQSQFAYNGRSQMNMINTNATHCFWGNRGKQHCWEKGWLGLNTSDRWPEYSVRKLRETFHILSWAPFEIDIDFHQL